MNGICVDVNALGAHIHVNLAVGAGVIQADHHGLVLGQGIGHHVFEGEVAEARQLIHLAGIATGEHMGESPALGAALLAG